MSLEISILVDNYIKSSSGFIGEYGLSMYISFNKDNFIFDTGQTGIGAQNAFILKKDLKNISKIILSHGHCDHIGGLKNYLKAIGREINIYSSINFEEKKYVIDEKNNERYIGFLNPVEYFEKNFNANFIKVSDFYDFGNGVFTISNVLMKNEFEKIPEKLKIKKNNKLENDNFSDDLSLILETKKGLVVLLGCAHRGMINISSAIKEKLNKNIYAIIGGTHLMDADTSTLDFVIEFIKSENIKVFAPNHCTGIDKIIFLKNNLPNIYQEAFCGSSIFI